MHAGRVSWAGPGRIAGETPVSSPPPGRQAQKQSSHGTSRTVTVHTATPSGQDPGSSPHITVLPSPHSSRVPPNEGGRRAQRLWGRDRGHPGPTRALTWSPHLQPHALPKWHCYSSGCLNTTTNTATALEFRPRTAEAPLHVPLPQGQPPHAPGPHPSQEGRTEPVTPTPAWAACALPRRGPGNPALR